MKTQREWHSLWMENKAGVNVFDLISLVQAECAAEAAAMQKDLDGVRAERASLHVRLSEAQHTIGQLEHERQTLKAQATVTAAQMGDLRDERNRLAEELARERAAFDKLQAERNDDTLQRLRAARTDPQTALEAQALRIERDALQRQLELATRHAREAITAKHDEARQHELDSWQRASVHARWSIFGPQLRRHARLIKDPPAALASLLAVMDHLLPGPESPKPSNTY